MQTHRVEYQGIDIYWSVLNAQERDLVQLAQLTDYEKQLFDGFQSEARKIEWLTVRGLINTIFKKKVLIAYADNGQPFLTEFPHYNISISHTKTVVAIAISQNFKIGVDVEMIHPRLLKIADKFLNNSENDLLQDLTTMMDKIRFLTTVWSAKESFYKIIGSDVDYRSDLSVKQFPLSNSGALVIEYSNHGEISKYLSEYRCIDNNNILSWIKDRK